MNNFFFVLGRRNNTKLLKMSSHSKHTRNAQSATRSHSPYNNNNYKEFKLLLHLLDILRENYYIAWTIHEYEWQLLAFSAFTLQTHTHTRVFSDNTHSNVNNMHVAAVACVTQSEWRTPLLGHNYRKFSDT